MTEITDLGRLKPPFPYLPRGSWVRICHPTDDRVRPQIARFLQWVRSPGLVLVEEPWYARVINENGRIETFPAKHVRLSRR